MQSFLRYCVGLDLNKDTLQVCLSVMDATGRVTVKATTKVANTPKGFATLIDWVGRHRKLDLPLTYLMESTGVYHEAVAWYLVLVAETNGFEGFTNQRHLVSYAGYDVVENQSGTHSGKTRISKKGNSHLRRILHMPAFNAVRFNEPICKALYDRVYQRSGIKMKAYMAVQKRLLLMVYALWRHGVDYDPLYLGC